MSTRRAIVAGLLGLPFAEAFAQDRAQDLTQVGARPKEWATPLVLDGAPNLHQVEKNFFRSAQPDATGFKGLSTIHGVRTVISLRAFNSDEPLAAGLNLTLERVRINTWNIKRKDVVTALQDLRRASRDTPVLLHCQHGADRTGMITALYRILYQGWSKVAALDEMQNGMFGYHAVWGNIPRFIRRVDVEELRRDVGVP
jgi:protein tyrosine/serine phosphatase